MRIIEDLTQKITVIKVVKTPAITLAKKFVVILTTMIIPKTLSKIILRRLEIKTSILRRLEIKTSILTIRTKLILQKKISTIQWN
jgi:hypothetical protein